MKKIYVLLAIVCATAFQQAISQQTIEQPYRKAKLIFKDDFDSDLKHWIIETPTSKASKVAIEERQLLMDVDAGATVWLNKKLSGNIMIEYTRKVIMKGGKNDRLSDLNQFWMASDPVNKNLFTRTGAFKEYDSLLLYYVGFGGNNNKTTRFRKYNGSGDRVLYHDLNDKAHLLEPNKTYSIRIVVYNGETKFFVDNEQYFSFKDDYPLKKGYFAFRTTQSRQSVDSFRIYKLK